MSTSFLNELDQLIRARYPLIYVVTSEEERTRKLLAQLVQHQKKALFEWSITEGLRKVTGPRESGVNDFSAARAREPLAVLNEILQADTSAVYVLKDFHRYLDQGDIVRQLRDLAQALRRTRKTVILLAPRLTLPDELDKAVTVVDLPLPTYDELADMLNTQITGPGVSRHFRVKLNSGERDALIKAAQGLTLTEAENAFARAIARDNVLDGDDISTVADEKKQVIRKNGLLEYCDTPDDLDAVGGMTLLKAWLEKRVRAFSKEARDYGLPQPRGILLLGVQGCGKSLVSKTVAASWRLPLLRMDMSRIFQGYVGSSEENMRRALQTAESLAPVVLWIDEVEKAFSGIEGSNASDGGTTARVIGLLLTWLQEKKAPVFVVATANNLKGLPPELLRKGRLDEIFFVDLPRGRERAEIFQIHLKRLKRDPTAFDLHELVAATRGFSGAEIEQVIISALHDSFFANRDLETADLMHAVAETVPLSRTMREDVQALRSWAKDRARPVAVRNRATSEDA